MKVFHGGGQTGDLGSELTTLKALFGNGKSRTAFTPGAPLSLRQYLDLGEHLDDPEKRLEYLQPVVERAVETLGGKPGETPRSTACTSLSCCANCTKPGSSATNWPQPDHQAHAHSPISPSSEAEPRSNWRPHADPSDGSRPARAARRVASGPGWRPEPCNEPRRRPVERPHQDNGNDHRHRRRESAGPRGSRGRRAHRRPPRRDSASNQAELREGQRAADRRGPRVPRDDTEDLPIADDGEQDPPDRAASWDPWVRLTIFRDTWGLSYHVEHPDATSRAIEEILDVQDRNWENLARTLIDLQHDALACPTALEALETLWAETKQEHQRSVGQLSRDRHFVIGTPFGTVPLDFFFMGRRTRDRKDTLYADLRKVGQHLTETGAQSLSTPQLRALLPHLTEAGIESTRKHVAALIKVLAQPHILARHRQFWPQTSTAALYDDLGIMPHSNDRSAPAGILAILGAFERGNPVLAQGAAPRLPRETRRP
ncbi:MAG: hypothetical protein HZY73_12410 [Micropruina sp.]|nr:MAG: hypothetical protein HZY73_12410 [Micropruina sp.]